MWNDIFYLDSTSPTGLRWKIKPNSRISIGDTAGGVNISTGYVDVRYNRKLYGVHRVIWELHYGSIPSKMDIDHIDGNQSNNDILNLRLASRSENNWNSRLNRRNTTGTKGLSVMVNVKTGRKYWACQVNAHNKYMKKTFSYTAEGKLAAIEWLRSTREYMHKQFTNYGGSA